MRRDQYSEECTLILKFLVRSAPFLKHWANSREGIGQITETLLNASQDINHSRSGFVPWTHFCGAHTGDKELMFLQIEFVVPWKWTISLFARSNSAEVCFRRISH